METLGELHETLSFHGIDYVITLDTCGAERLTIEAEEARGGRRWMSEFTAEYVQDLSAKTGNFKTFDVFVKMLYAGLRGESDSVFVDLLTYQDLELLKARKNGKATPYLSPAKGGLAPNPKRYLIMTYAAEFDRVHYPLPLNFEPEASRDSLQRTIRRLREENGKLKGDLDALSTEPRKPLEVVPGLSGEDGPTNAQLRAENSHLRQKLRATIAGTAHGEDVLQLQRENDRLRKELRSLMSAFESYRQESTRQVRRLKKDSVVERFAGNGVGALAELSSARGKENALNRAYFSTMPVQKDALVRNVKKLERMLAEEKKASRRREGRLRGEVSELRRHLERERRTAQKATEKSRDLSRRLNLSLSRRRSGSVSSRGSIRSTSPATTQTRRATPVSSTRRRVPSYSSARRKARDHSVGSARSSVTSSGATRRSRRSDRDLSKAAPQSRGRNRGTRSGYSSASSAGSSRSVSSTRARPLGTRSASTRSASRSASGLSPIEDSHRRPSRVRTKRRPRPKKQAGKPSPMSSVTNSIASDAGLGLGLRERKNVLPTVPDSTADGDATLLNPDDEVNDIDKRLQQLQMFLQQAKRGMDMDS